jgi:hypothetical protein
MLLSLISRRSSLSTDPTDQAAWRSSPQSEERTRLMDQIIATNPSATIEFLSEFSSESLEEYLAHVQASQLPRGRRARWVRPSVQRGIECYESAL